MDLKAPSARTRVAVVIGDPVEHSASPALHNAAFEAAEVDAVFVGMRVSAGELPAAVTGLRALGVLGVSVTIPHKRAVLELCDRVEEPAASIGAVNCLCFEDGEIVGHNTDAGGFVDGIAEDLGFVPAGKNVVLLGAGGAARAVAAGLAHAGAEEIAVVARTPSKCTWAEAREWSAENLAHLAGSADLVVDCTSRALSEETDGQSPAAFPVGALHEGAAVVSLVYHRSPELLVRAEERGLMIANGYSMLVHQGARAFRLWTGKDAPVAAMWAAIRAMES